ncbi:phytanoyl-CoA dioxygenase family protein [Micromonospora sp. NPDC048868]|uniref:phytanoyl-CoA dioxygenase family protein n=1 Tax=Micromonospora sp. NPDC048868 TaxID=3364258 RepID=UPI00371CBCB9
MSVRFVAPDDPTIAETLDRDGVVFLHRLFDPELISETRRQLDRYEREVLPTVPRASYDYQADGVTLHQYRDVDKYDAWFKDLVHRSLIMDVARRAVSWDPMIFYLEVFPKPAGAHGAYPHQDLYTAPVDPPHFLHLWVPLEDVTGDNGGIYFYPRTHKLGVAPHIEQPGMAPTVDPTVLEKLAPYRVQVDCPAGSAAIFGGDMIHQSGPNRSDRARPALVIGFRGADTVTRSETEVLASIIQRMYREEIDIPRCLPDDSFYSLGGSVEAANRILDRLGEDYGVQLTEANLAAQPTPMGLAALVLSRHKR